MTRKPGTDDFVCDRCGVSVGNAGVDRAAIISDLDPGGELLVLHLCRAPRDGAPRGCVGNVLGEGTLAHYYETRTV